MEKLHQHKKVLGTNKIQRGSNHRKTAREIARYNSPVDPTLELERRRFNRRAEPAAVKSEHRLIRRMGLNSVGQTGVTHRMIRQNKKLTHVQLSIETTNLRFQAPVKPT